MKRPFITKLSGFFLLAFASVSPLLAQNGVGVNTSTPKSSFEDNGSFGKKVTTITASTTLDDTHGTVVCNNSSTAITVTLPAASTCAARVYEIKRNAAATATVTISVTSAGTIDGAASYLLSNIGQSVTVFSDGSVWLKRDGSNEGSDWTVKGNSGTIAATNFIGTTDGIDFVVRTTNVERARFTAATPGAVGIGTTTPITYGRLAVVSNGDGNGREDDLGIASFNTSPSPTLLFFSARGTEGTPTNVASGDDILTISGKARINGNLNTTSVSIISRYRGSGTTNLSDMSFLTSNSTQMTIDETGEVGIGITAPTSRLHVVGQGAQTTSYSGTFLTNTATSSTASLIKTGLEITSMGTWNGGSASNIGLYVSSVTGGTANYDAIFNGGGNVGIGTASPGARLQVVSNVTGVNVVTVQNSTVGGYSSIDYLNNSGTLSFTTGYGNASSPFPSLGYLSSYNSDMILTHNGATVYDIYIKGAGVGATLANIGIGTNVPQQNLSVQNGLNIDQANTNNGNVTNALTFGSSSGEGITSKRTATGNQFGLDFYTSSTNRMAITSAGYVGVGTTAPVGFLTVKSPNISTGVVRLENNAVISSIYMGTSIIVPNPSGSTITNANGIHYFDVNGDGEYFVMGGTTIPDKDNLKDLGATAYRWKTVYAVNGTINTSDERQKKNIHNLNYGIKEIMQLRPVTFNWKSDTSKIGKLTKVGLIAQEVRKVVPEVVVGDEKVENLGVFYSDLVPVVIKGVQEQQATIEKLQVENAKLKSDLAALMGRVAALEKK